MYFKSVHEVRYSDIDYFGHVNHLRLLEFFQTSRNPFLAELARADGAPNVLERNGFRLVRLTVDFRAPVGPQVRSVEVRTSAASLGNSSVTLSYELWCEDRCCVESESVLVFVNEDEKPEPMSAARRRFFTRYLRPNEDQS
jgi:acyl-CoA thioester hydrolase